MTEKIYFPEELIPEFVAMIRRGLADEPNARIKRNTEMQLKALEKYWKEMNEDETGTTDAVQAKPKTVMFSDPKKRARRR